MNEQSQDPLAGQLRGDEALSRLAAEHHQLEDRLHELTARPYLSQPEQVEEMTLKKRKLQIKDRMEFLRRRSAS
jgi:uncharacterized protein YdcH (DUF465 family)